MPVFACTATSRQNRGSLRWAFFVFAIAANRPDYRQLILDTRASGHPPYNGGFLPESVIHVTPDYVTQKGDTRSIAWYGGLTNNHENHGMGKSRTFERWLVTGAVVTAFVFMAAVAAESDHERSVFGGYVLALFR